MSGRQAGEGLSDTQLALAVGLPTLLSRLPFLLPGYGADPDGWRIAHAGWLLGTKGVYMPSRDPGFPVQELVAAVLFRGGPLVLNGATALMSAVAAACFALLLRKELAYPAWSCVLAGLAFACVPVVYIESTTSMDYLWALAFLLASICALQREKSALAGILLGLAIGCRITTGLFALPLAVFAVSSTARGRIPVLLRLFGASAAVTLLAYSIVLAQPRWSFDVPAFLIHQVNREELFGRVPAWVVRRRGTVHVWGDVGCVVLACSALALVLRPLRQTSLGVLLRSRLVMMSSIAIALVVVLFLRVPHEPGYLIPIVPFVLWLLAALLRKPVFAGACCVLLLAPWLGWSDPGPEQSALLRAHHLRQDEMSFIRRSQAEVHALRRPAKVVAGRWYMPLEQQNRGTTVGSVEILVNVLEKSQVDAYRQAGFELYYIPGAELARRLEVHGFKPLFEHTMP